MGVEGSMKVKGLKNDPEIHTDMAVSFFGQKMSMSTYYVNGTYYVDSNGSKTVSYTHLDVYKRQGWG